ncbi:hypothetical protein SUGI_1153080 [Cryptomeria japonica]|uniref:dehydration-responsive element-binding protein 1D n=1 Tax=Cryptomeria japonica TaxID=3369 RepID=UPI00241497E4|nr:dehydration-responsive element-binding protein 1D [Cryptomeria japonica]GLJ53950.1 hypothetical protein SUGI_1153080 [Cryptomeria japonica]
MVQSPNCFNDSDFLCVNQNSPPKVVVFTDGPCVPSLTKSWSDAVHKKLKLDDTVAFSHEFYCKFVCGESSEERGGDGSPSKSGRTQELEEPGGEGGEGGGEGGGGGGGAGGSGGGGSSSPSLEEQEEEQQQQPQRGGTRRGRGGGGGGRRGGESRHPVYRGVRKRHGDRWVSEIREPGKKSRIWLGTFPTPEMAARAYDTAAFNIKKPYAFLNFPESVSSLPLLPLSSSPKQIQEAAAAAAAAFQARSPPAGGGGLVPTAHQGESSSSSSAVAVTMSMSIESMEQLSIAVDPPTPPSYFDEDMIFDMPNVLTDMAEGLMITPPLLNHGVLNGNNHDYSIPEPSLWDP